MSLKAIPTRKLGKDGPLVSAIGLGAMGMGAFYGTSDDKASLDTLTHAANRGVTFWDTSDIYGTSQNLIGEWFTTTGRRSEIFLATKFGARDPEADNVAPAKANLGEETSFSYDKDLKQWVKKANDETAKVATPSRKPNSKPSYIVKAFRRSLAALKTDYVDLYYQHRVDPEVPIEIVIETLKPFVESGQIRWIGLSECSIDTLKRAKAVPGIGNKVIAAQMEFSPFELHLEKTGFVDASIETGTAVVAYSPLARGLVTGRFKSHADFPEDDFRGNLPRFSGENFPKNLAIVDKLQKFADKYNATTGQITLAWILAEHANFIPIPGVRSVDRLEENAHAAEIELEPADVKEIRAVVDSAEVVGERYQASIMPQGDCIPLSEWKGENLS